MAWFARAGTVEHVDILVVCTGNVCRSPQIAAILKSALPHFVVTSAGTGALVGDLPGELVVRTLAGRGIDYDSCRRDN